MKQAKPMDVQDHPENVMPDRVSQVNPIMGPPDPGLSMQGPAPPGNSLP